jgi:seryl-tRNA synthetase
MFLLLGIIVAASSTTAFCPPLLRDALLRPPSVSITFRSTVSLLQLVTEEDVNTLVDKAEELWSKVERLRSEAKDLSIQAESLGREAESIAVIANEALQLSVSKTKLEEATNAQNKSLDLGALLDRVKRVTDLADEIEIRAEKAIAASEAALEQYLIDFPEEEDENNLIPDTI